MSKSTVPNGSKALVINLLFRANVANPNAGWTEENVTAMKKVELPDGQRLPYISGQALRRYLRDTMKTMNAGNFSPQREGSERAPIQTEGKPDLYIDDDLFGFLNAGQGTTKRREAPLKVSAAIAQYPFAGDLDLGTRSALEVTRDPERGGAVFETEVTNNIYSTTWLVELDRLGVWQKWEHADGQEGSLSAEERSRRAAAVVRACKYLEGGARQSRLLMSFLPEYFAYARLGCKAPILLDSVRTEFSNGTHALRFARLLEVIKDYQDEISYLSIGLREGFGGISAADLRPQLEAVLSGGSRLFVGSIGEAIETAAKDVQEALAT